MPHVRLGLVAVIPALVFAAGCASRSPNSFVPSGTAVTYAPPSPGNSTPGTARSSAPALPDGYDPARNAKADIKAALAVGAKTHRELLIDFGANWCPDCTALDVMFRSAQVEPLLRKDYVVVAVDVGQFNHNLDLAAKYVNLQASGIPALVVLNPHGALRFATNNGSFENARAMTPSQVRAFLIRWAPSGTQ